MSDIQWKIGDLAQLKSGGPVMTVDALLGDGISCRWFAGAKLEKGNFSIATLQKPVEKKTITPRVIK